MKTKLLIVFLFTVTAATAQKDGEYFSFDNPVCDLWEFDGASDDAAPIVNEMTQQFFFMIPGGSEKSMMAPFYMQDMGFACPTYFKCSADKNYIYLEIGESCMLDMPEEAKYVKLKYRLTDDNESLILTIDKKEYRYVKWGDTVEEEIVEESRKMTLGVSEFNEMIATGGWHPESRQALLYKGIHTMQIKMTSKNGQEGTITLAGIREGTEDEPFRYNGNCQLKIENNYFELRLDGEGLNSICKYIYGYVEDDHHIYLAYMDEKVLMDDQTMEALDWWYSIK